jgi:hypothetical protein
MSRLKPFALLRAELVRRGWTYEEVALLLDRSTVHVTRCFNAWVPWNQVEQYKILDEFEIPYERMHEMFPKNGYARTG